MSEKIFFTMPFFDDDAHRETRYPAPSQGPLKDLLQQSQMEEYVLMNSGGIARMVRHSTAGWKSLNAPTGGLSE
jgi:hypothetical protein